MNKNQKTAVSIGVIIVAILISWYVIFNIFGRGTKNGFYMMDFDMMGGFGIMFFMPFLWIAIIGLIVFLLSGFFNKQEGLGSNDNKAETPMEILKRRYALGEIDKEEFEEKKKDLI